MPSNHFDVIVIGVGSMGSATCYYLARNGCRVLGLEQFGIVHEHGSHFGQSRIIRKAYFEHADYVPLLQRAYENWEDLEEKTGTSLYYRTGVVYFGPRNSLTLNGIRTSAATHNVDITEFSHPESRKQFRAFDIPDHFETLFEPDAGFVTPERTIRALAEQAQNHHAVIHADEKVLEWNDDGSTITVKTDRDTYHCNKIVFTSGSWTSKLVPELSGDLKVTRQVLAWINPANPTTVSLGNFPCWFVDDPTYGIFYGFPVLPFEGFGGPLGLKLACHSPGPATDPDRVDRHVGDEERAKIEYALGKYLPGCGKEFITLKTCLYTHSPDDNFVIDFLPGHGNRVVIACGFSGHGFKFVPVIGEILADLAAQGTTRHPIAFLGLGRLMNRSSDQETQHRS